jgi:hypothetical protein
MMKFIDEAPHVCGHHRTNSAPTVSQTPPYRLLPSSLEPAHLPDPLSSSYLQWNNAIDERPKLTAALPISSRLSHSPLEAITAIDQTNETPSLS